MASAPHFGRQRTGFAVRRLQELLPPSSGRDWDVRFVSAVLLLYGLVGASFYLVDWLNDVPAVPAPVPEVMQPFDGDGASDAARVPYLVRLPQVLKQRSADVPPESR